MSDSEDTKDLTTPVTPNDLVRKTGDLLQLWYMSTLISGVQADEALTLLIRQLAYLYEDAVSDESKRQDAKNRTEYAEEVRRVLTLYLELYTNIDTGSNTDPSTDTKSN